MSPLTLMAVHAHPDDESLSTGGVFARYGAEGVRTVLVTCTDGSCGDGPDGVKPGEPGHDRAAVAAQRMVELEASCKVLGITDVEMLGYADSGMMGWPQNDEPGSFWGTPVEEAAGRLTELMERYRPQVVVTYDPNGFYGHPDHIQAHRITVEAFRRSAIPDKLYYTAVPRSRMAEFGKRLRELGIFEEESGAEGGQEEEGPREEWGTPDEEITTVVDVSGYTTPKLDSLKAHASQSDNIFFIRMGPDVFAEMMGHEAFVRVEDSTGAALPEEDLFAGLRD